MAIDLDLNLGAGVSSRADVDVANHSSSMADEDHIGDIKVRIDASKGAETEGERDQDHGLVSGNNSIVLSQRGSVIA